MAAALVLVAASLSVGSTTVASATVAQERAAARDLARARVVIGQLAAVLDATETLPHDERHGSRNGLAVSSKSLTSLRRQVSKARRTAISRVAALKADRERLRAGSGRRRPTRADGAVVATLTRTTQLLQAEITGLDSANRRITAAAGTGTGTGTPPRPQAGLGAAGYGRPEIVSIGDSYISGEAGRWAGNVAGDDDASVDSIDLGADSYYDNNGNSGELIPGCHRSKESEVQIFVPDVYKINLACSGATTDTFYTSDGLFKPGIDFRSPNRGYVGQAEMLRNEAGGTNVRMVVLSIGGNNFSFANIITDCVEAWVTSIPGLPVYCSQEPRVRDYFSAANIAKQTAAIGDAIKNVNSAMLRDGYNSSQWTLVVQDYPDPLAPSDKNRYSEDSIVRQSSGGCGMWDEDIDWARTYALPTINAAVHNAVNRSGLPNIKFLDLQDAFVGHRLCENTVDLLPQPDFPSWETPDAINKVEWVDQIHATATGNPFFLQESLHPNYFGQFALRECLTLVYNNGSPRGGKCTRRNPTPQNNYVEQLN